MASEYRTGDGELRAQEVKAQKLLSETVLRTDGQGQTPHSRVSSHPWTGTIVEYHRRQLQMKSRYTRPRMMGLFLGIVGLMLLTLWQPAARIPRRLPYRPTATPVPTPTEAMMEPTPEAMMEPTEAAMDSMEPKEAVKVYTSNWTSVELNTRIPAYIIEHGYGYPVEYIPGTTTTMLATFPARRDGRQHGALAPEHTRLVRLR